MVETSGGLVWMELEAIDPMLFFGIDPAAAGRFAEVVSALATRDA